MQDADEAIKAILTSNLIAQFKQANGEEPSAEEVEEMISEMKEAGLYDEAAERISELLGAGADEDGEDLEEQEEQEEQEEKQEEEQDEVLSYIFKLSKH